ncbi:hypothetical protein FQR65_LT03552 [Abscondita terminalis]|nr:hypothetical protein FQR65_LT03552 [Abscondita terminalis]
MSEPSTSDDTTSDSNDHIDITSEFDELMWCMKQQRADEVEDAFLDFVEQTKSVVEQWAKTSNECQRLQAELTKLNNDYNDLEMKLSQARKMLDRERKLTRKFEKERDEWKGEIRRVANVLNKNRIEFPEELSMLDTKNFCNPHRAINTTGSLLSNFSYSRSEDDLDESFVMPQILKSSECRNRSPNATVVEISATDTVRATTTLTLNKDGPITATCLMESIPAIETEDTQHRFYNKTLVMPETCVACSKRIKFGCTVLKCKDCHIMCHPECRNSTPTPCVFFESHLCFYECFKNLISDYTPTSPPMVPALILHCTKEIETRKCDKLGVYRIPGVEKDVKTLKQRLLQCVSPPCLNPINIYVICDVVKDFLHSLTEPLLTKTCWNDLIKVVEVPDRKEMTILLNQIVSELPRPNRDTLAHMMLHLRRITESSETSFEDLAKIFAPIIIGSDSNSLEAIELRTTIMENLITIPNRYWELFLENDDTSCETPSSNSCRKSKKGFTPYDVNIGEECKQLKDEYDACFNAWFSDQFLRGQTNDSICKPLFRVYQECVKKVMKEQNIELKEVEKDLLGTSSERKPPTKNS